jgi:hypothetical protein
MRGNALVAAGRAMAVRPMHPRRLSVPAICHREIVLSSLPAVPQPSDAYKSILPRAKVLGWSMRRCGSSL